MCNITISDRSRPYSYIFICLAQACLQSCWLLTQQCTLSLTSTVVISCNTLGRMATALTKPEGSGERQSVTVLLSDAYECRTQLQSCRWL